jgi:DNA topoisomerase-2
MYLKVARTDEDTSPDSRKVVYEKVNSRWEVCVTVSNNGFQQASFVNSIATTKGGKHLDHVVDPLVTKIAEAVKKKNKGGMELRPHQIKSHLWVFVNCLIENPAFDSQTKENMTLKQSAFGSKCEFSEKFVKEVLKCGVVESCVAWAQARSKVQLNKLKKGTGPKNAKLRGIAKLDDANNAGGKAGKDCTLIVTEGDSAKALAISGLGVVGRDNYGVFPLRGKLLNARDASHKQLMSNEEIMNLVKILGLEFGKKYGDDSSRKTLRYGHLMIMADQDQDGSHIKGLVINFIHHNWPELVRIDFIREFITPLVKASKGGHEIAFFSLPEFEHWKNVTENSHSWKVKYYKGLGTSTAKEAKEYFSDMDRHCIEFKYCGVDDDDAIELAFSKDKSDMRKEWLTNWLARRREKRDMGLNESYLYGERVEHVSYSEFVNKELILFSNADNERSIPSLVDGLKPGQRKVLFTCLKRNDKREVKVAQLAGSVAELSAYHHGEASLMSTIINLAQGFVGSNNVSLLQPLGQFGTRLCGGKDAASPRYIFTMLSPLAKKIFISDDDHGLKFLSEDNLKIEPEWYCPVVPLVLLNGCDGIGTGYSTSVPNHDPREVVENLKRMMNGLEPLPMTPKYKNFTGTIAHVLPTKYSVYGNVARLSSTTLEITELPIRRWTQDYKESVLEPMLHGTEKTEPYILDYKEYHTDTTVKFVVTLTEQKMVEAAETGFHKKFKLEGALSINNMVLFDANGCLKRYGDSTEILKEFYLLRLDRYRQRKTWLEGKLQAESDKITQQARFVLEMYNGSIIFQKKSKSQMIGILKDHKYPGDPVSAWKLRVSTDTNEEQDEDSLSDDKSSDYNYLLGMPMWNMSLEKKNDLLRERDKKVQELETLRSKTPKDLWIEDLDDFLKTLNVSYCSELVYIVSTVFSLKICHP